MVSRLTAVPSILQVVCQSTGMGFAVVSRVTGSTWTACAIRDEISFPIGAPQIRETRSPPGAVAAIVEIMTRNPSRARIGDLGQRLLSSAGECRR